MLPGGGAAGTRRSARAELATALFVLGCAAAALACFAMTLPTADAHLLQGSSAPTDLRAASEQLLVAVPPAPARRGPALPPPVPGTMGKHQPPVSGAGGGVVSSAPARSAACLFLSGAVALLAVASV